MSIAVPATVANLGPGFDVLALALQLQNEVRAMTIDSPALEVDAGADADPLLNDPSTNLICRAYVAACAEIGVQPGGARFSCVNRIPMGRGLGSSAAAVLSGVLTAVALHHAPWDADAVLRCAAALEGHGDNVAAALLGGLAIWGEGAPAVSITVPDELRAIVWVPDAPLSTAAARTVVPHSFARRDAVFNASRVAMLVRALALPDYPSLRAAMQDRWHQDARAALTPGAQAVMAAALQAGAAGAALAGAGPSVIALSALDPAPLLSAMEAAARDAQVAGSCLVLQPRNFGTRVDVRP